MSLKKFLSLALTCVTLDQLTKTLAQRALEQAPPLKVLPFLNLTYIENTGISFGLFPNAGNGIFLALNSLFLLSLAFAYGHYRSRLNTAAFHWSFLLLIAGGLGNVTDRIFRGFVVDFIDFKIWPVFNVADSLITAGAILYASHSFFSRTTHS